MAKDFKDRLPNRKVNIFLICLICSFLAWLVSKLSETQTDTTSFELVFTEVPDSLLLDQTNKILINARVKASGFQFLSLYFDKQKLAINLSELKRNASGYFIPREAYQPQVESQLPGTMELVELDKANLYIDFLSVHTKRVPVIANVTLDLGQNHLLDGPLRLEPDSINIKGPLEEIDSLDGVITQPLVLKDLNSDFNREVALVRPEGLKHTVYSSQTVRLSGTIFRFSEKIIEVPIIVIHLPEGTQIKTFPNTLPVLCKARIERLKDVDATNFRLVADYNTVTEGQTEMVATLTEKPEALHSVQLMQDHVEFILKRE